MSDFLRAPLGKLETPVFRLGLSASYRPGRATVWKAIDEGLNYFFYFGFDTHMTGVLRDAVGGRRDQFVLATGGYNGLLWSSNLRRTLESRLRQMRTDYIDVFHYLGVTNRKYWTPRIADELQKLRESGLVRAVSISCHDRKLAAELAGKGALDAMMIRYNAAHRGAEREIFPLLPPTRPAVVSFTATRWTYLLRRPKGYPKDGRVPDAGMCYRFVLSNPNVHVCLTAPRNVRQLEANLAAVRKGPLAEDEMQFMRDFGDAVYRQYKYFM
jgi:aryl-alcohol dehydrogenase-like predicted oxidoreductase